MKGEAKTNTQINSESVIRPHWEQEFRSLAENLPDIIARFDRELRHLYINPGIEAITGYPPEAFIGKTNRELGMPEDLVVYWDQKLSQVFETGLATTAEFAFPTPNGIHYFESHIIPEVAPDNTVATILAITHDMTERKKAEEALRTQNRELALLNKAAQTFISTLDLNGVLTNVLVEVRDLLGVTGGSAWLVDPATNDLVCWQAAIPEHKIICGWRLAPGQGIAGWVTQHGQSIIVPDTRLDPRHFKGVDQRNGVEIRSILCVPLLGQQEIIGVLELVDTGVDRFKTSDIELVELLATTATIAIDNASLFEALLDSEKRYRTLFENTPISLWEEDFSLVKNYLEELRKTEIQDFKTYFQQHPQLVRHCLGLVRVVDVNKATLELHQVEDKALLLGSLNRVILNPDPLPLFIEQLTAIAEDRLRFAGEVMLYTLAGNKIYVDLSWSVAPGSEKTYQKVIISLRDITERKRTEEEIRRHTARMEVLADISQTFAQIGLDYQGILRTVARRTAELIGDACVITLFSDDGQRSFPAAFHHPDPKALALMRDALLHTWQGGTDTRPFRMLLSGEPIYIPVVIPEEYRASSEPEFWPYLDNIGISSILIVPLRVQDQVIGTLGLTRDQPGRPYTPDDQVFLQDLADRMTLTIQNARLFEQVQGARERLQALSRRLLEVQETERRHIARELHDEVGEILTGLKLVLELSTRAPVEAAKDKLETAKGLVDELMSRVEELSLDLRPAMLDDLGLLATLLWHFERYTALTQVQVNFQHANLGRRFRPEVEIAAYRIVQEALTNVARYAAVAEVSVQLWANQDVLNMRVADQGIGFDLEAVLAAGASSGLAGMVERAALVEGQLVIESAPGKGVRLTAELPLRSGRGNSHRDNHRSGR